MSDPEPLRRAMTLIGDMLSTFRHDNKTVTITGERVEMWDAERERLERSISIGEDAAETARADCRRLQDQLDLNRDEFLRIKACPAADEEIKQLCDRSQERITQHTPVLSQRDNAIRRNQELEAALAAMTEEKDAARCVRRQYEGDAKLYHERLKECISERDALRADVDALRAAIQQYLDCHLHERDNAFSCTCRQSLSRALLTAQKEGQ